MQIASAHFLHISRQSETLTISFLCSFSPLQGYFSTYQTDLSEDGAKPGEPQENHIVQPQAELGLSQVPLVWPRTHTRHSSSMMKSVPFSHLATGPPITCFTNTLMIHMQDISKFKLLSVTKENPRPTN